MYDPQSLNRWAAAQGWSRHRAYRAFHAAARVDEGTGIARAELIDAHGRTVYAERHGDSVIRVYPDGPPDQLAGVSAEAIVAKLVEAGYFVLTRTQAQHLGLVDNPDPIPSQIQEDAR